MRWAGRAEGVTMGSEQCVDLGAYGSVLKCSAMVNVYSGMGGIGACRMGRRFLLYGREALLFGVPACSERAFLL